MANPVVELNPSNFRTMIDGKPTDLFTIRSAGGLQASITNFGAKIEQVLVPQPDGTRIDVVQGYDSISQVIEGQPSMGAFVGRYANRIGNARFSLDGIEYKLAANNGTSHLHGGTKGSRICVFDAKQLGPSSVEMSYRFDDGEEGYPGTLATRVVYSVTDANELLIEYAGHALDKKTVASFTSHSFFNLSGDLGAEILDHVVTVNADHFLPVDAHMIPTGEIAPVSGTVMDFREPRAFRAGLGADDEQLIRANGYDHHFVINQTSAGEMTFQARVEDPNSGRSIEVWSTEPGLQLVTGNVLSGAIPRDLGKGGTIYNFRTAFYLEPSRFPDSPNKPAFPSTVLEPGQIYTGRILYRFGA